MSANCIVVDANISTQMNAPQRCDSDRENQEEVRVRVSAHAVNPHAWPLLRAPVVGQVLPERPNLGVGWHLAVVGMLTSYIIWNVGEG